MAGPPQQQDGPWQAETRAGSARAGSSGHTGEGKTSLDSGSRVPLVCFTVAFHSLDRFFAAAVIAYDLPDLFRAMENKNDLWANLGRLAEGSQG